jgi:hypothetical protein
VRGETGRKEGIGHDNCSGGLETSWATEENLKRPNRERRGRNEGCLIGREATEHNASCQAATKSITLAAAESDLLHCDGPACWSFQSPITAAENNRNGIMLPNCMGIIWRHIPFLERSGPQYSSSRLTSGWRC